MRATITVGLATAAGDRTMVFSLVADGSKFKGTWVAEPPIGPRDLGQILSAGSLPAGLDEVLSLMPFRIQSVTLTVDPAGGAKSLVARTEGNSSFAAVLV
ncbi:hypothetical protein [Streptomyces sp. FIT100]|uniref:hypothetical protein n=1 Tax=Streptomyces sp. FIT100 TaxID=2837956 RepID=UPI0021C72026|nr:hypothetical protein [Streptomyces sp. FIT100]UUN30929.1 hypothetical protein KK483_34810 [Streptomyces sp. FIT100]